MGSAQFCFAERTRNVHIESCCVLCVVCCVVCGEWCVVCGIVCCVLCVVCCVVLWCCVDVVSRCCGGGVCVCAVSNTLTDDCIC